MKSAGLIGCLLLFDALALWLLYPRIDLFSAGYLALSTLLAILQAVVYQRLSPSEEVRHVFYARHLDSLWDRCVAVLGLAELAVFFEYSKGPLLRRFAPAPVQAAGLALLVGAVVWLLWVDRYLLRHFDSSFRDGRLLTGGPYRYVRHPRYAGLLATRVALPLLFGSAAACLVTAAWIWLIRRRVRLEEDHLRAKFGDVHERYATETRGLLW